MMGNVTAWTLLAASAVVMAGLYLVTSTGVRAGEPDDRWRPRYQLYAPLPEAAGIGFQVSPTKPQLPTVHDRTDFRDVHFADGGMIFDFTFLDAAVVLHPVPPLGAAYPKMALNKPVSVETPWVNTVVLRQVGHNIVVTCHLRKPGNRASLGTSPPEFVWGFTAK